MAKPMKGLKVKPTYAYLIGVAFSDGLEHANFLNRGAFSLRNGLVLSQLDGGGARQMQLQQEEASRQAFKDSL